MSHNADPPSFHYLAYHRSASGRLPGTQRESKNEGSDLEVSTFRRPTGLLFSIHCPGQDPHSPIPSPGSVEWENVTRWTPGVASSSSQEVFGDAGMFGAVSPAYPTYSDTYLDQDLLPTADGSIFQAIGRPPSPYPPGKIVDTVADNDPFGMLEGMERQQTSELICMERSPSESSSVFYDHDGLTAWSGPDRTSPASDQSDHGSFGLLPIPLEDTSSCRSIGSTPDSGRAVLRLPSLHDIPNFSPNPDGVTVSPLPLPELPISWVKIPQRRYAQRGGGTRSLSRLGEAGFSVNGARGFNMQSALDQFFTGLDGRDDPVLENAGGPVSCRLLFPGYPPNTGCNQIAVKNWKRESAPITKSKLAYEVAKRVKRYLDASAKTPIDRSVDSRWTIGQGFMKLENMYLVSIVGVSRGSLQPEIWVDVDAGDSGSV